MSKINLYRLRRSTPAGLRITVNPAFKGTRKQARDEARRLGDHTGQVHLDFLKTVEETAT